MSLINSFLLSDACLVVCDTQAGALGHSGPAGYACKVLPIQRLGILIGSTGSGDLFDRWAVHLQSSLAEGLDALLAQQPALLGALYAALDNPAAHRSSMFVWGWSARARRVQGWVLNSRDGFEPTPLADGYTLKPPPKDMGAIEALPPTDSAVERMQQIVSMQLADDAGVRCQTERIDLEAEAAGPLMLGGELLAFVLRAPTGDSPSVRIESWTVGPIGHEGDRMKVLMSGRYSLAEVIHRIRLNRRVERIGQPVVRAQERAAALLAWLGMRR